MRTSPVCRNVVLLSNYIVKKFYSSIECHASPRVLSRLYNSSCQALTIGMTEIRKSNTAQLMTGRLLSGYSLQTGNSCDTISSIMSEKRALDFSFNDYDIIGFDLDGTLLRYNLNEMVPMVYELMRKFLVEEKKYPVSLLAQNINNDFFQKGLIIDADNGNILKLGFDSTVLRATHGTRAITSEEIIQFYGAERKWDIAVKFFENPLTIWNGPLTEKMRTLLDYFDIAVSLVFAQTVDILDAEAKVQGCPIPTAYKIWPDILECLIRLYTRDNFANGRSGYFEALRAEPSRYLLRTHDDVIRLLRELRHSGKLLYLLTGSNIDFANLTASFALGSDWQQLFDCVVCFAKKPGFFTLKRPYLRVSELKELPGSEIDLSKMLPLDSAVYTHGNWEQMRVSLSHKLGKSPNTVRSLYVGDNIIQDIYTPVEQHDLDAVTMCEELLADDAYNECNYEYKDVVASSFWGSYFFVDNKPTLWAKFISRYSQLCIPLIGSVAETPISNRFSCDNKDRYYPKAPSTGTS